MDSTSGRVSSAPGAAPVRSYAANTAQVSVRLLVPFVQACAAAELRVEAELARVGISAADLGNPDLRISHALIDQLLRFAMAKTGDPDIGLHAAALLQPEHLDLLEYIARSQPCLRDALESMLRFRALLHDAFEADLTVNGERALLRVSFGGLPIVHCADEFVLATLLMTAQRMTGLATLLPLEVQFAHPQPKSTELHQRIFGSALKFGQGHAALVFPRTLLDAPLISADPGLAKLLLRHAETRLSQLGREANLQDRVRRMLRQDLGVGRLTVENLARQLGMSSRTLHRRLAAQGGSFQSILDSVRYEVALSCLRDPRFSIREVSDRLGFTTGSAFHRAFRRWTGSTPTAFRDAGAR